MKKVIFFDIDGTLIDCTRGITEITKGVEKSIRELQAQGNYIFIATGRPYAFISEELLKFGFDGFVFTNGAQVVVREELIYKQAIKKDVVKEIINNFEKFNIEYILEGEKYSYMKSEFEELYEYYDSFGISSKYIKSDYNINDINIYKMEMLCKSKEAEEYCLSLQENGFDCNHNISSNIFEVYSSMETKASGIMQVLNHLNIPIENSYAFGDGINDVEMLEVVGCGIAMGNASLEVKSHAKKVTDDVARDGITVGIEKFIN
ncbi:HAD family hydrolase [Clostridium frigoris]|uniref:HAD family hydrolase n=1 Tax=Clostridium frigoris TaxID=205327 RepID=A0ABS6BVI4_9CLOT|nr:HAD family hydrolase [Clostridium frigoris]MBU3160937.1 HAD family hydrolase [Clostridium frigoris]